MLHHHLSGTPVHLDHQDPSLRCPRSGGNSLRRHAGDLPARAAGTGVPRRPVEDHDAHYPDAHKPILDGAEPHLETQPYPTGHTITVAGVRIDANADPNVGANVGAVSASADG
ncbi:hypothetical protein Prum_096700 [Phytohabitans rumicis]|uniref:Uncharacterized protein n=1 Tax=Phytohabitans rumicis TaxID=1076125 RepID=A0A6V8LMD9_9ACTN|nr:hypothetical protein Prum_096700 [Phytohabitans rumicis]